MAEQPEQINQIKKYALAFEAPLEQYFFSDKDKSFLESLKQKYYATEKYVEGLMQSPKLAANIDKDIATGRIYSLGELASVKSMLDAMQGLARRVGIKRSIVNSTGQCVILSEFAKDALDLQADGYFEAPEETGWLVDVLKEEGLNADETKRIEQAAQKYKAIVYQIGIYSPLKQVLEGSYPQMNDAAKRVSGEREQVPSKPAAIKVEALPFGFIEYLKNNDKEYDRVEHEIMQDEKFQEFSANLKKRYSYYQKMSGERLAGEVIIRSQLWNKLKPQTKAMVEPLVARNRGKFLALVGQVAAAAGADKLSGLRQSLAK